MPQDKLTLALNELDKILTARSLKIEIVICGAYAIQLYEKIGLGPKWLNDQASTVSIPNGTFERLTPLTKWSSIKASVVDRKDLIKMKASAYSIRREYTTKDWEDLQLLVPTAEEVKGAIAFIKQKNSPPANSHKNIKDEFEETLNDLKKLIT